MADAAPSGRSRALHARLRDSVADFTAEKAAATSLFETCVDVLERLPILTDPANYPPALTPTPASATSLRSALVARQLESVDALCRALEEALAGMDAAASVAARAAADGAELARGGGAAAAAATGAAPSPADAAAALADAARAMRGTAACARVAAGAVEGGTDVGGLRALLRTLKDCPTFDEARVADAIDAVLSAQPAAC